MSIPHGCYVWDGWLGECKQWHEPAWYEYVNVYSILAVIGGVIGFVTLMVYLLNRILD